jgi:hypothetical protein
MFCAVLMVSWHMCRQIVSRFLDVQVDSDVNSVRLGVFLVMCVYLRVHTEIGLSGWPIG